MSLNILMEKSNEEYAIHSKTKVAFKKKFKKRRLFERKWKLKKQFINWH